MKTFIFHPSIHLFFFFKGKLLEDVLQRNMRARQERERCGIQKKGPGECDGKFQGERYVAELESSRFHQRRKMADSKKKDWLV